jgi:hypothetical protein
MLQVNTIIWMKGLPHQQAIIVLPILTSLHELHPATLPMMGTTDDTLELSSNLLSLNNLILQLVATHAIYSSRHKPQYDVKAYVLDK